MRTRGEALDMAKRAPTTDRSGRTVPRRPKINRTDIDGVPCFWREAPGPLRSTLVFRVGQGDEVLPEGGISHLVEHLAFSALEDLDFVHNGFVEHDRTVFWAAGEPEEVVEFLNGITGALSDPDEKRIEAERQVLSVEAQSRGGSLVGSMLAWRYGPVGPGLVGHRELGLNWLDGERVRDWSDRYFTAGNAVLWMSGPPPRGLRLQLPDGERRPRPAPGPVVLATPTCFREGPHSIGLGALIPKSVPALAAVRILERRLQRRLRRDLGISYHASSYLMRVDDEVLHMSLAADVLADRASEALLEVLQVADEIANNGVTEAEIERDVTLMLRAYSADDATFGWLDSYAHAELHGDPEPRRPSDIVRELRTAPAGDFRDTAKAMLDSAIGLVPAGSETPEWPFTYASTWSSRRVEGAKHVAIHADAWGRYLLAGEDGVTVAVEEDKVVTVRFDHCEAAGWWDDGSRVLWGRDGFVVSFQPWQWKSGSKVSELIDRRVPSGRRVHMGPGAGPPPQQPTPMQLELQRTRPGVKVAAMVLWMLVSVGLIVVALVPPEPASMPPGYECAQRPSVVTAIEGPDPTAPSLLVDHACVDEARNMAIAGGMGLASAAGCAVVGVRWLRRRADLPSTA